LGICGADIFAFGVVVVVVIVAAVLAAVLLEICMAIPRLPYKAVKLVLKQWASTGLRKKNLYIVRSGRQRP
jgi:archaellin